MLDNILFDLGISAVLTALKQSIKDPKKKSELKRVFLKIRNQINSLYANDPDFE